MKILVLNGANLNLQGSRNIEIYGAVTFEEYMQNLAQSYPTVDFVYRQSNIEGELIDALHKTQEGGEYECDGVVFNAGGYTHTSVALRDAIEAITTPVVEVHISQIAAREEFRHTSLIAPVVVGSIMGFGLDSYRLGVEALIKLKR